MQTSCTDFKKRIEFDSDKTVKMVATSHFTPHLVCESLANQIKQSQLNFIISETPYSVKVDVKKRLTKSSTQIFFNIFQVTIWNNPLRCLNLRNLMKKQLSLESNLISLSLKRRHSFTLSLY